MMDWTDRHCRYFHRLLSQHTLLYTEMISTGALLRGDRERFLKFHDSEHPLALQLGGSNPKDLADCAKIAEDYGYDEVNLNVGCPSDRVQNGSFGACLMAQPDLVADCIATMQDRVKIPVTVKSRIGIDDRDSYQELYRFIETISSTGCKVFIIHARKALLNGLSPKQNREIPPLRYDVVYRIKRDFPHLRIIINGGVTQLPQVREHIAEVDGVMIGREAYHNPYMLAEMDSYFYNSTQTKPSRHAVIQSLMPYINNQLQTGVRLHSITRHILGLFHGQPGARKWRQYLSENAPKQCAPAETVLQALAFVPEFE